MMFSTIEKIVRAMEWNGRIKPLVPGTDQVDLAAMRVLAKALDHVSIATKAVGAPVSPGMKGDGAFTALMLKAADTTVGKVIEIAASIFSRPGAPPVEIEVEIEKAKARVKFDPRTLKPEELSSLVAAMTRNLHQE